MRASIIGIRHFAQAGRSMALSIPKWEDRDLGMRAHLFQARAQHSQSPGTTYAGDDERSLRQSNVARCSILTKFKVFPLFV
jgi:hypothetical protein